MRTTDCVKLLMDRNVFIKDIIDIVYDAQIKYNKDLTRIEIKDAIISVLSKREVQHTIITGIELDMLAERKMLLNKELNDIINEDEPLYGIDEILALSITNLYGSIALTNFGYFDKAKPGIIKELNIKKEGVCNTFLDDIVCAIASATCSKLAHNHK